ncbi:MAG TPA: 30S ribosomal protein S9, partial [Myxococcota bacterium]|nr:30S ribosomal protein S9 [Myxococcota bacterium]
MNRFYATGRRKVSSARVWLKRGTGQFLVNGQSLGQYFKREVLQMIIKQPFEATETLGTYDVNVTVSGGGLSGQAGAVRHGISRALQKDDTQNLGPALKRGGFLTRD